MKNKPFISVILFVSILVISNSGCFDVKSVDDDSGDNQSSALYVNVFSGATGTPATGTYTYETETTVDYSYSPKTGYRDLKVTFDDNLIPASGSIQVTGGYHFLKASCTKMFDVRGRWTGYYNFLNFNFYFEVSFNGDYHAGEAVGKTDQIETGNGRGDYTVSNDEKEIDFTLAFTSYGIVFHFLGTIENNNKMKGTYSTKPAQWLGVWELNRAD